jgi:hypothetical protein
MNGRGGGGGGGSTPSGNGGSGIVIVRYSTAPSTPTVTLGAPKNNQVFAHNASIAATATVANATGITSVDFQTNSTSITGPYGSAGNGGDAGSGNYTNTFVASAFPAGTNYMRAVMTATEGVFTSAVKTIIVETPPVVTVTSPTEGQSFANLSTLTAVAAVSHGIAPYTVTFYTNNATAVGSDSSSPYESSSLGPLAEGTYQIYAKVVDSNPNGPDTAYSMTNTFTVLPPAPTIAISPATLDFGTKVVNTTNTLISTVSGANLTDTITVTVTPYPEYQISTNNVDFTDTYTLAQTGGTVPATTNYVRFSSAAAGTYNGAITNISGSVTQAVTLACVAREAKPVLDVSPTSINLGNVITNKTSANFTYALSGDFLSGDVTVTAPTDFLVATNPSVTFAQSCIVSVTSQTLPSTTIYVQFTPSNGSGAYAGGITNSTVGYTNSVGVAGTGVVQTLSVSAASLNFGYVKTDSTSNRTYTVSGINLDADVTLNVTGDAAFQIKTNGGSFGSSVTLTVPNKTQPAGGTLSAQTITVQFAPTAVESYGADITAASAGAESKTTALSGNGAVQQIGVQQPAGTPLADGVSSIDFGSASGTLKTFVVTNSGVIALTFSGITKTGDANDFAASALPASLAAGASTTFTVTFTPTALGARSAVLRIGNGTPDGSFDVTLTGTGVAEAPFLAWGGDVKSFYTNYVGTASQVVYCAHQYTNVGSASFIPSVPIKNLDCLVVAGGGGGSRSSNCGGGGGAGGLIYSNGYAVIVSNYTVTVGQGGAGVSSGTGNSGSNSVFASLTAHGGGGGGSSATAAGAGGSGGGAIGSTTAFPLYLGGVTNVWGQGNNGGGNGYPTYTYSQAAGGGGGAGAVGQTATNSYVGGNGGDGLPFSLSGVTRYYAGGGGGGGSSVAGTGGLGGGANGSVSGTAYHGTSGLGGGGGGITANSGTAGNGGSGIVIVRYALPTLKSTVFLLR